MSSNNEVLQQTMTHIKQLDSVAGFAPALIDIVSDATIPDHIRYAAIIHLKNLVTNQWRHKDARCTITIEEKNRIREVLLALLREYNHEGINGKIAQHLAIITSIVARADYPKLWPNLFPSLFALLEQGTLDAHRTSALMTIKCVVNELASRRFVTGRQEFYDLSAQLFQYFSRYCDSTITTIQQSLPTTTTGSTSPPIATTTTTTLSEQSGTHLILAAKIIRRVVEFGHTKAQFQQPFCFVAFIPTTLEYFTRIVLAFDPHTKTGLEPLKAAIVQSVQYLQTVTDCKAYQCSIDPDDPSTPLCTTSVNGGPPISVAQQKIISFFSRDTLAGLLRALVSNYLIITPDELELWAEDPETYVLSLDAEANQADIKPSAYNLFIVLMRHFHTDTVAIVVEMLTYVTTLDISTISDPQLLLKEACYMTIGLGYYELYDTVNFEQLFANVLVAELRNPSNRFNIIRRRICWLIGYWVTKIPQTMRPTIVQLLIELANCNDLVISLTAADALKSYIDDYSFELDDYLPYVDQTLLSLLNLFNRTTEVDTKTNLLAMLGVIFVKLNENIKPYAQNIITLFSALWQNGEAPHLLKNSIVRCMTFFLQALNRDPSDYFHFVLPIIEHSTMPNSEESVYLLEDGLELWHATMCRVSAMSQPLLHLFRNVVGTLNQTFDHQELCMKILDAYVLLGHKEFLGLYSSDIVMFMTALLGDIKDEQTVCVVRPLDRILQMFPQEGAQMLQPVFARLHSLILSPEEAEEHALALIQYLGVFARLATVNPSYLLTFLDAYSSHSKSQPSVEIARFMEAWFDRIDSIGNSEVRKLTAIGLSNLLAIPRTELLPLLGQIVTIVVGIRADIDPISAMISFSEDGFELPESSGVDLALKAVSASDPLTTVDMSTYLFEKMKESSSVHGPQVFQQAIQSVHPSVIELACPLDSNNSMSQ
eukprot:gene1409-1629_t